MDISDAAVDDIVSTAHLRILGIGPDDVRALVRAGTIRRLIRGWYAVRPATGVAPWEADAPWEEQRALHRLRTLALVRSFDGRVVASHHSALLLHGIATWQPDLALVHLCRTDDDHSRHRTGAVIHPSCGLDPVDAGPCRTVPLATAIVQAGLRPVEGAPPRPMESLVAADDALHRGLVEPGALTEEVVRHAAHPGIVAVRALLEHADGRHESPGETRLAHVMRLLGYETEPQVEVRVRGRLFRADLRIKGTSVFMEFDGVVKYLTEGVVDHVAARRALVAEKDRHDSIVDDGGEIVRVTWPQLDHVRGIGVRVHQAVARWRRRNSA